MAPVTPYEDEAVRVDAYLDALMASRPTPLTSPARELVDPELVAAVGIVRRALVRFHPSFRFEELLAGRLRREAERMDRPGTVAASSTLAPIEPIAFPASGSTAAFDRRVRGALLLRGAIASGVSIAGVSLGAALIAWHRSHTEHRWERLA